MQFRLAFTRRNGVNGGRGKALHQATSMTEAGSGSPPFLPPSPPSLPSPPFSPSPSPMSPPPSLDVPKVVTTLGVFALVILVVSMVITAIMVCLFKCVDIRRRLQMRREEKLTKLTTSPGEQVYSSGMEEESLNIANRQATPFHRPSEEHDRFNPTSQAGEYELGRVQSYFRSVDPTLKTAQSSFLDRGLLAQNSSDERVSGPPAL